MCRIKKSVIADILDDALLTALAKKTINSADYRELCVQIGTALKITDLIPRGKRHREAVERTVKKACEDSARVRAAIPNTRVLPKTEPVTPAKPSLVYLQNRSRKSAA